MFRPDVIGDLWRILRVRLHADRIARLPARVWRTWPIAAILKAEAAICGTDTAELERLAAALDLGTRHTNVS